MHAIDFLAKRQSQKTTVFNPEMVHEGLHVGSKGIGWFGC